MVEGIKLAKMTILTLLFQFACATQLLGRADRHTRYKSLSKKDEEGLVIEKR